MIKNKYIADRAGGISSQKEYDRLTAKQRSEYVRSYYAAREGKERYSTSPDYNLRELEIDFILANVKGPDILDLGCGNGYTLLRTAEKIKGNLIGVDFSAELIKGAEYQLKKYKNPLKSRPVFLQKDVVTFVPPGGANSIDTVITERFLLNLPTQELQYAMIKRIHSFLRRKGLYIMIEGSKEGLSALNDLRKVANLKAIPDRGTDNLSSLKFDDARLKNFLQKYFDIINIKTFDLYYIISRVVYPHFIFPENPKYAHTVNTLARLLDRCVDFPSNGIGHVKGYVFKKK